MGFFSYNDYDTYDRIIRRKKKIFEGRKIAVVTGKTVLEKLDYDIFEPEVDEPAEDTEDMKVYAPTGQPSEQAPATAGVDLSKYDTEDNTIEFDADEEGEDDDVLPEVQPKSLLYDPANPQPMQRLAPNANATQRRRMTSEALIALPELGETDIKALKTKKDKSGAVIGTTYTITTHAFEAIVGRYAEANITKELKPVFEYDNVHVFASLDTIKFVDETEEVPVETIYTTKKGNGLLIGGIIGGVAILAAVTVVGVSMISNGTGKETPVVNPGSSVTTTTPAVTSDTLPSNVGLNTWVPNAAGIPLPDTPVFSAMNEETIKAYLEVTFNKEVRSVEIKEVIANGVKITVDADWLSTEPITLFDPVALNFQGINNDYVKTMLLNRAEPVEYDGTLMMPVSIQVSWSPELWAQAIGSSTGTEVASTQLGVMTIGLEGFDGRMINSNSSIYDTENAVVEVSPDSYLQFGTGNNTSFTIVIAVKDETEWANLLAAGLDFSLFNAVDGTVYTSHHIIPANS